MHILCKWGNNHHEWYAMSASPDRKTLDAEALRLNVADYEAQHKEWVDRGRTGPRVLALDDPKRQGFMPFFVEELPDWPSVNLDGVP